MDSAGAALGGFAFIVLAGISGCTLLTVHGCQNQYSDGDRVGTVSKISYKGLACKTWEGDLAMDNFVASTDGSGSSSNDFAFSVAAVTVPTPYGTSYKVDPAKIVQELQAAQQSGARVDLHYDQVWSAPICMGMTDYFITAVTPATRPTGTAPSPFIPSNN